MEYFFISSFTPRLELSQYVSNQFTICPRRVSPLKKTSRIFKNLNSTRCCVEQPHWKRGPIDVDFAKDEQLQILEEELDIALETENFSSASTIRDKLLRLQSGSYVSVLSAHFRFYKAFTNASIVDMAGCWLQDPNVSCKHPLGDMSIGYINVINSFGYLFSLGTPSVQPLDVRINMRGSIAYVTCNETSKHWKEGEFETPQSVDMAAINIFMKRNGDWYLYHHSALPILGDKI